MRQRYLGHSVYVCVCQCVCVCVWSLCVVRALVEKICQEMLESAKTWSENRFCSVCFFSLDF
jgi:hypothetical protein